MDLLTNLVSNNIIDYDWTIYKGDTAYMIYEDSILEFNKIPNTSDLYNIKYYNRDKYITCYNGLYYELDNINSENSYFYIFNNGVFIILVSYKGNRILSDNFTFITKQSIDNNIFVFYFCDIDQCDIDNFIKDDSNVEIIEPERPINNMLTDMDIGTILADKPKLISKVVLKPNTLDINTLYVTVDTGTYIYISLLEYIIEQWDRLPELLFIICEIDGSELLLTREEETRQVNTYISLDETKRGVLGNDGYVLETNSAISKDFKLKNFWIKELKMNIPPKGLVYYNRIKNRIIKRDSIMAKPLEFYKGVYNVRNKMSLSIFEMYLQYSFNYIFIS